DGLMFLEQRGFDLAIVDWQLPSMSGPSICRRFRQSGGKTPILMLTEKRSLDNKEEGLDSGADDYLGKPFEVRELGARVRALLRRSTGLFESNKTIGKIKVDSALCRVTVLDKEIQLVPREFKLFEFLMRHPNVYFSADKLIDYVWESSTDVSQQALRVCINRIRSKLDEPSRPSVIENSKGWGYKIADWYLTD
ncbi:MAG: response regulator transcription factor, partial [Cyanobacteria bacterium]|nr:response regulator transcription factor [Cyanobacteriota bacterium]